MIAERSKNAFLENKIAEIEKEKQVIADSPAEDASDTDNRKLNYTSAREEGPKTV